ncbi:MAG: hypothetical protein Q8N56_03785 [bacterium]|nr:hypothetical protein [bacterium]
MKKLPKEIEEKFIREVKERQEKWKMNRFSHVTVEIRGKTIFPRHCKRGMIILRVFRHHEDGHVFRHKPNYYGCMQCGSVIRGKSDFGENGDYLGDWWEKLKGKLTEIGNDWINRSVFDRDETSEWLEYAKRIGATHLIRVFDSAELERFPIYVMPNENAEEIAARYNSVPFASTRIIPIV